MYKKKTTNTNTNIQTTDHNNENNRKHKHKKKKKSLACVLRPGRRWAGSPRLDSAAVSFQESNLGSFTSQDFDSQFLRGYVVSANLRNTWSFYRGK